MTATERTDTASLDDGRNLGLRIWPGTGVPVVLIHGLLDCSLGWRPVAQRTSRHCVGVDLPGLGASDPPSRPRLSAYAQDVLDAIDQLGVERFLLVGHSLGGGVAASMADCAPDRVAGLTLIAPVGFGRVPAAEVLGLPGVAHAIRVGLPYGLRNRTTATAVYRAVVAGGLPPDPELLSALRARAQRSPAGVWAANQAIVAAGRSRRRFAARRLSYDGPVDVLWGDRDRLVPLAHLDGVKAALPQARTTVWPGMAHHPQRERPGELTRFLQDAWSRAEGLLLHKAA